MKKTILEWFEQAKENGAEWADKAINTTIELRGPERLNTMCTSPIRALMCAFAWDESQDGHEHWEKIAMSLWYV